MGYLLEMQDVSKSFGEVKSLRGVDFHATRGEVVGLLGDNGAGKSTMIKIMTGYYQPDTGELHYNGEKVENLTVAKARDLGIETVFQERALADLQPLWRNIYMGRELRNRYGLLDVKKMREETQRLMVGSMGFTFNGGDARFGGAHLFRR